MGDEEFTETGGDWGACLLVGADTDSPVHVPIRGAAAVTGAHGQAVARAEQEGDVLVLCRLAGQSFARQHPQLIRRARKECVRTDEMVEAFRDGLAARSPDQIEFDLYWENLERGGQLDALKGSALEDQARAIAEFAWMTSRRAAA